MGALLKVIIIRHAEKPRDKGQPPYGVTSDGEADFESLTVRGWQRAGALVPLFLRAGGALAVPTVIYASRTGKDANGGSKSKRPRQTIAPLAKRLGLEPNLNFGKGDEAALAVDVLGQAGVVLISWQHELIAQIARHLVQ